MADARRAARANKRAHKWTRYLMVVLGALATLASSIASASFNRGLAALGSHPGHRHARSRCTARHPRGFSQNFQWGATWREMVTSAERLGNENDRMRVTAAADRDPVAELALLNHVVLEEPRGFFDPSSAARARPRRRPLRHWGAKGAAPGEE